MVVLPYNIRECSHMADPPTKPPDKDIVWLGNTKQTISEMPVEAKREIGFALRASQRGGKHLSAKPLTGEKSFKGAAVLEIVTDEDGDTYRAVYTVRFSGVVYILHAFKKKSKTGIKTPIKETRLIKARLAEAERHYEVNFKAKDAG